MIVEHTAGPDAGSGCVKDVDLVFVMDISGSMLPFFEQLDSEILVVDQTLSSLALPHPQRYGLVVFVDDVEVTNDGAAYASVEELRQAFIRWRTAAGLDQIRVPQFNGSFVENSLDALHAAATRFQWRGAASTHRMIVHVTDDTFWDGPAGPLECEAPARNGCATIGSAHAYPDVVELLRAQKIWTHAFAAHVRPLSFGFVGTGAGFFEPWKGAPAIPEATGGEAWEILDVLLGSASLSQSINEALLVKRCETYPPPLL